MKMRAEAQNVSPVPSECQTSLCAAHRALQWKLKAAEHFDRENRSEIWGATMLLKQGLRAVTHYVSSAHESDSCQHRGSAAWRRGAVERWRRGAWRCGAAARCDMVGRGGGAA